MLAPRVEDPAERRDAVRHAWSLTRRVLVVAARLVDERPSPAAASPFGDGVLTRLGTFQKFFEQQELRIWIDQALDVQSVAAAPGIFYVFRDPSERSAFLASRFRRTPSSPRPRLNQRLYVEHRELLDALAAFVSARGRLPAPEELEVSVELEQALGSVKRAFRLLQEATEATDWEATREARTQDTLLFLALAKFEGRPRLSDLAADLQLDVKAFFGSYSAACRAADDMLFSLGRPENLEEACRASTVGKLMPNAIYVHADAVADLPLLLRLYEGCARNYVGRVPDANIVKLGRGEPKISYLSYPDFERDPHPALAASTSVHLQTFRVRERNYRDHANPPILHRKETFVSAQHPARAKFARLTRHEEAKGLYDDPASIGTRDGWSRELRARRLSLRGHRLVSFCGAGNDEATGIDTRGGARP